MSNYINFYFNEDDKFVSKIHKNGKYCIVENTENILKLIKISNKFGYKINHEGVIKKKAKEITKQYDHYIKRKKRLKVLGKIASNMVLSRKNKTIGKTILVAGILTTIAISSSSGKSAEASGAQLPELTYSQVTENNDYNNESLINDLYKIETEDNIKEENIQEESTTKEINKMFESDSFHFSYEDRSNKQNVINAKRYEDLFEKYANQYGLDKDLLIALASQESSGEHYKNLERGPAAGIMQIEKQIHLGTTIKAYNFNTNEVESIKITEDKLNDIETNIKIGSMIFRNYLEANNYNVPLTLQTYNFGPGNMSKVLKTCAEKENIKQNTMKENPTNNKWLNYRSYLNIGDDKYVEHVFSFLKDDTNITVKTRDNKDISINISNDYVKDQQLT